ncbi:Asparagine--tRNA ligase, cytoplasmic [Lemmus lemmus]
MSCDFWELVGLAPAGGAIKLINEKSDMDVLFHNRHMMIRGENMSKILKAWSMNTRCLRDHFLDRGYPEAGANTSRRAEQSRTRRTLADFMQVEAECPFLTFQYPPPNRLGDLVCYVVDRVLKSPVYDLNPNFKPPKRPFRQMNYSDAIDWPRERNVKKEYTTLYKFGEDIPEAPERLMTDTINEPILLCRFPVEIKSFYMKS